MWVLLVHKSTRVQHTTHTLLTSDLLALDPHMSINAGGGSLSAGLLNSAANGGRSRASTTRSMTSVDLAPADSADASGGKNKLGTCNGVIIPCLLNIFGAILFVRLPWAVGQSGWLGVVLQFALGAASLR